MRAGFLARCAVPGICHPFRRLRSVRRRVESRQRLGLERTFKDHLVGCVSSSPPSPPPLWAGMAFAGWGLRQNLPSHLCLQGGDGDKVACQKNKEKIARKAANSAVAALPRA